MRFLLPTRIPKFDFQFQLLASQDYWTNFKGNPLTLVFDDDIYPMLDRTTCCPVGSLEFCAAHGIKTLPRNIPPQLKDYACGLVVSKKEDLSQGISKHWHVKSAKQIKHKDNGQYLAKDIQFEDGDFQAVEWLKDGFISEWRCFVFNGNLVDMQNYAGDIWTLPSKKTIMHMIYDFEHAPGMNVPPAYTLDVGVVACKLLNTKVIEVHDFYSCGTYNFNDHYRLPSMLWAWWQWYRASEAKKGQV